MKFISAFSDKNKSPVIFDPSSRRTEQKHKDECNINNIVAKYQKTGAITHRNENRGSYGYATSQTYQECLDTIMSIDKMFGDLPSKLRQKFNNDPAQFLDFVQDEANAEEMVALGLAVNRDDIAAKTPQKKVVETTVKEPAESVVEPSQAKSTQ